MEGGEPGGSHRSVVGGVSGAAGGRQGLGRALDVFATLSTAAGTEADKETTTKIGISSGISMRGSVCLCGYMLELEAKATYYLNCKTGQASKMMAIAFKGSEQKTKVRAVCGYL